MKTYHDYRNCWCLPCRALRAEMERGEKRKELPETPLADPKPVKKAKPRRGTR